MREALGRASVCGVEYSDRVPLLLDTNTTTPQKTRIPPPRRASIGLRSRLARSFERRKANRPTVDRQTFEVETRRGKARIMGVSPFLPNSCNDLRSWPPPSRLGVLLATPIAQTSILPVDEVRPGMVGIGRTVFDGTDSRSSRSTFSACCETSSARRNLDSRAARGRAARQDRRHRRHERQSRLHRRPTARRGVVLAGPVFDRADCRHHADRGDDGRHEPRPRGHAPGRDVVAADTARATRSGAATSAAPVRSSMMPRRRSSCGRCHGSHASERHAAADCRAADCAGFAASVIDRSHRRRSAASCRFRARSLPAAAVAATTDRPLRPGDAMGVALLTGDFMLGATGTVTYVDGDRVYGVRPSDVQPRTDAVSADAAPTCRSCCPA